jgi:hypothetical protein
MKKEGAKNMKKMIAIMIAVGAASVASADWTQTLNWGSEENFANTDGLDDVYASVADGGAAIPQSSTWAAQILDVSDLTVYLTATHLGGGSGFWEFYGQDGVAFQAVQLPITADNRPIFTRLFNNADPLLATMKADVGVATFDWNPLQTTKPTAVNYDFGTVASGDWVAIPEPGAASLLILGAGTFLVRRMRARFAAK